MDVCIIDYGDHQNCERCEATKESDTNSPPDKVHTDSTYHTHSHNSDPGEFWLIEWLYACYCTIIKQQGPMIFLGLVKNLLDQYCTLHNSVMNITSYPDSDFETKESFLFHILYLINILEFKELKECRN